MATLLGLPNEILAQILSYDPENPITLQPKDLGQVALVSRRLAPLAQREIFKGVLINTNKLPGRHNYDHFKALVESSSKVARYVERLHLQWYRDRWEVSNMIDDLLASLPSMRSLSFETDSPEHSKPLDFSFFDRNQMLYLKRIHLSGARMTFKAALRLVQKPGLLDLTLGRCEAYGSALNADFSDGAIISVSSLECLDTTASVLLDIELFQLLSYCRNLTTLKCDLPRHLPEEEGDRPLLWHYRVGVPASRQRLSYCLKPVSNSLTNLTIRAVSQDSREAIAPDLTFLAHLRCLQVEAASLWPTHVTPYSIERRELYNRLPTSLEELEITFEAFKSQAGIFWPADQINSTPRSSLLNQASDPARYEWIIHLGRSKQTFLPFIKKVHILEQYVIVPGLVDYDHWETSYRGTSVTWNIPTEVDTLFRREGIDLSVLLRLPEE